MLLTLSTTHRPATDLGYLLHKNPKNVNVVELAFGEAKVFYTEASEERCTAVLLLDLDPVKLSRRRRSDLALEPYVNDRPYVVSSFFSVALARTFGTALAGRSKDRPELVKTPIPLKVEMPVVPSRGGESLVRRLFEPLGYEIGVERLPLDEALEPILDATESPYVSLTLTGTVCVRDLLRHLYVLIPVLDDRKHYWVGEAEIEKLLRKGEGWLGEHPEKELISHRYLDRRRYLSRAALQQLDDESGDEDDTDEARNAEEETLERKVRLHDVRLDQVRDELVASGATTVLDLGCGEGKLLRLLVKRRQFERLVGVDASTRALEIAHRRLHLEYATPKMKERLQLLHGALTYRDERLEGFDAAALVEVIEHLDPPRLSALETVVFGRARPETVVVTTPNREYNSKFESLPAGRLRHRDHRFEWTRAEFREWCERVAEAHGYEVRREAVGEVDEELGAPGQMAVFRRDESESPEASP